MRYGNQSPTFESIGAYHHSAGERLCDVFESWGTHFYPCQRQELTLFMARDEDNRFASRTICISKPRQNGKSFGARKYAITMAAKGKRVLYSAHNGSTVRKMFKLIADECDQTPDLARRVRHLPGCWHRRHLLRQRRLHRVPDAHQQRRARRDL